MGPTIPLLALPVMCPFTEHLLSLGFISSAAAPCKMDLVDASRFEWACAVPVQIVLGLWYRYAHGDSQFYIALVKLVDGLTNVTVKNTFFSK